MQEASGYALSKQEQGTVPGYKGRFLFCRSYIQETNEEMTNIFDIIADLCSYAIKNASSDFFLKYSCFSPEEKNTCYQEAAKHTGSLFISTSGGIDAVRWLKKEDLTDTLFGELTEYIAELKDKQDMFGIVVLLQILDEGLAGILMDRIYEFQNDNWSIVLNENRETTGVGLLPRCSCVWERKNRLAHSYNRLDNFLYNILILRNDILRDLIDRHIYLKDDFFPDFEEKRMLKIAATPLRLERGFDTEFYQKDRVQYFRIVDKGNYHTAENELIWTKIRKAGMENCDIILFPEMLGNPDMVEYVQKKISEEKNAKLPPMIILPSLWENDKNTVTVLDREGKVLCRQQKQNPFTTNTKKGAVMEGITPSLGVNIFHYEGIGRIAILICKDFLTTEYLARLMHCFKLTLIIVPSFSTGSYDFRQSFDICAHDDCNVVWINSCAAIEKGKEANFQYIGHVRKRIGRLDDDSLKLCGMKICSGAFSGKCNHDCLYYATISEVKEIPDKENDGNKIDMENLTAAEFLKMGMSDKAFIREIAEHCRDYVPNDPKEDEYVRIRRQLTHAGRKMGCKFTERQMGEALNNLKSYGAIRVIFRFGRVNRVMGKAGKLHRKSGN